MQGDATPLAPPVVMDGEAAADRAVAEPEGPYVPHWLWFDVGFRTYLIFHDGYDVFSANEVLGQGAFSVGFTPRSSQLIIVSGLTPTSAASSLIMSRRSMRAFLMCSPRVRGTLG